MAALKARRAPLFAGVSIAALLLASPQATARQLLGSGLAPSAAALAAAAAQSAAQDAARAARDAGNALRRGTLAIQAQQAAQQAARDAARIQFQGTPSGIP